MRTNLPITNQEYLLRDGMNIVSRTDLKGRITYINDDFIEAIALSWIFLYRSSPIFSSCTARLAAPKASQTVSGNSIVRTPRIARNSAGWISPTEYSRILQLSVAISHACQVSKE